MKRLCILMSALFVQRCSNNKHTEIATSEHILVTAGWFLSSQVILNVTGGEDTARTLYDPTPVNIALKGILKSGTWMHTTGHITVLKDLKVIHTSAQNVDVVSPNCQISVHIKGE